VLQGGTAAEVTDWLNTNGYAMPPTAPELLGGYVAQKYLFVAVKLTGGAGIDQIHPLVVRYAGSEPCVPLKLTAVAAIEDMGVRTFFLGTRRVVPKNYKHLVLNPVMINWMSFAANYEEVVSRAADSPVANGRAFLTEYAGPASAVNAFGLVSPSWSAAAFVHADALGVVDLLKQQGLITSCGGGTCNYAHPLVLPLLRQYLPAPAGVDEGGFYDCIACYAAQVDRAKWGDGTGFARDLQERIIVPARHASDLLTTYPYLTRMYTTISPAEMIEDPTFEERDALPNVTALTTATQHTTCGNQSGMVLPDGREVGLVPVANPASPSATMLTWPTFTDDMPWVERVEEFTASAADAGAASADGGTAPLVLVDNREKIDRLLKAYNDSVGWTPLGLDAGSSGAGGAGGGINLGGAGGVYLDTDGGLGFDVAAGGADCGCELPGRARPRAAVWSLIAAAGMLLRNWRRERPSRPRNA
jgi:hypothetical protein